MNTGDGKSKSPPGRGERDKGGAPLGGNYEKNLDVDCGGGDCGRDVADHVCADQGTGERARGKCADLDGEGRGEACDGETRHQYGERGSIERVAGNRGGLLEKDRGGAALPDEARSGSQENHSP